MVGSCGGSCLQFISTFEVADMIEITTPNQTKIVQIMLWIFSLDFKIETKSAFTFSVSLWKFEFSKDSVNTKTCISFKSLELYKNIRIICKFCRFYTSLSEYVMNLWPLAKTWQWKVIERVWNFQFCICHLLVLQVFVWGFLLTKKIVLFSDQCL